MYRQSGKVTGITMASVEPPWILGLHAVQVEGHVPVDRRDDRTARHAGAVLQFDDDLRFDHDGPDRIVRIVGAGACKWRAPVNCAEVELADGSGEWIGDDEATGPESRSWRRNW